MSQCKAYFEPVHPGNKNKIRQQVDELANLASVRDADTMLRGAFKKFVVRHS